MSNTSHSSLLSLLAIPLLIGLVAASFIGFTTWSNGRQNTENAAVFANQKAMDAVATAGYRLHADFGGKIVAHCVRRDQAGPLPCDPFPHLPGADIRVASR